MYTEHSLRVSCQLNSPTATDTQRASVWVNGCVTLHRTAMTSVVVLVLVLVVVVVHWCIGARCTFARYFRERAAARAAAAAAAARRTGAAAAKATAESRTRRRQPKEEEEHVRRLHSTPVPRNLVARDGATLVDVSFGSRMVWSGRSITAVCSQNGREA